MQTTHCDAPPSGAPRIPRNVDRYGAGGLLLMAVSAVAACAWIAVFLQWVTR